ncbi:MAG: 30S ribosomal protein S16 [Planctomycetota bacterium]|jgi:small subunit ribosomal protein S16
MVRLRMTRFGKRNRPFYRIGVFDSRTRRDGRTIEFFGHYDPFSKEPSTAAKIDLDRAKHWLSVGAQPSEKVAVLLRKAGLEWGAKKPRKKRKKPSAKGKKTSP